MLSVLLFARTRSKSDQLTGGERLLFSGTNVALRWDAKESAEVAYRVEHEYFVHLIMDNLPCATRSE